MKNDTKIMIVLIVTIVLTGLIVFTITMAISTNELDNNLKIQECVNTGAEPKACKCAFTGCTN